MLDSKPHTGKGGLRHRLLQILVHLVQESFRGQPLLVGTDQQRQILGHEAVLDGLHRDLLQRLGKVHQRGIVVERRAMLERGDKTGGKLSDADAAIFDEAERFWNERLTKANSP